MSIVSIDIDTDTGKPLGYWKCNEFAKYCRVRPVTVRQWIRRGKIDSLKIGDEHYIPINTSKPTDKRHREE